MATCLGRRNESHSARRAPRVHLYKKEDDVQHNNIIIAGIYYKNTPNTGGPPDEPFSVRPSSISL